MKTRQSGMPAEEVWRAFFDPTEALRALGLRPEMALVAEFGCGYGTFTIPAARLIAGTVHAFDIEPAMVRETKRKAELAGADVKVHRRDFVADGTGLPDAAVDYAMLFNILHAEDPMQLLAEVSRILRSGALLGIMHWNRDPDTPRGPSMDIRPEPEDCCRWVQAAGFTVLDGPIDLPPYHYGIIAQR